MGNAIAETNSLGHWTKYHYESHYDRRIQVIDADNMILSIAQQKIATIVYDKVGNVISITDTIVNTDLRCYRYDMEGRGMSQIWQPILSRIRFQEAVFESDTRTEEELCYFERSSGILLPSDYKEFCQVFGAGQFGDYMRIRCPDMDESECQIQFIRDNLVDLYLDEGSLF
jgi:hypothetical protein